MKEHIFKQYPYRIELRAHTTPASSCSNLKPEELVQLYHEKGYDGLVITNHFDPGKLSLGKVEAVAAAPADSVYAQRANALLATVYGSVIGNWSGYEKWHDQWFGSDNFDDFETYFGASAADCQAMLTTALENAGIQPQQIDYINTHGTSTPLGDIAEVTAIKNVFGEHVYQMNLSSTKSMTGHMIGATGAVEAMACIMALKDSIIPPTINHEPDDIDDEIDVNINFTFNKAQKRPLRYALSNTFGFGGHNACLIFKKWEE